MLRTILFVPLFLFVLVVAGKSQDANPNRPRSSDATTKEIVALEDAQHEAFVKGDADAIDRIYTDDASLTYADGKLITKAQLLADIRSGKHRLYKVTHDDIQIRVYPNTVVVTGHSTATGTMYNTPRRLTNVYVKINGQWRLVAHHVTNVSSE